MNYRERNSDRRIAPGLRILCLHDQNANANQLRESLDTLGERLYEKHAIDLVYVNSPLLTQAASSIEDNPDRYWWEEDEEGKKFTGLDASLLLLRQVWQSMPFWGILGVGQGAAMASFLPLLGDLNPEPAFSIFVHGLSLLEEEERLIDGFPCLHIIDESAINAPRLHKQFGGQVYEGSKDLSRPKTMNIVGKFIIEQKKALRKSGGGGDVLALQNQLYMVEQEAADLVARRIAEDPPKALLAVISPQSVGGWGGGKRREFGEEGGGAPCPSDFLLQREKRNNDVGGLSRVHPSTAKEVTEQLDEMNLEEDGSEENS